MPDLSMCRNAGCPIRGGCYRYLAVPSEHQSYGHFEHGPGGCDWHWPAWSEHSKVRTLAAVDQLNRGHVEETTP